MSVRKFYIRPVGPVQEPPPVITRQCCDNPALRGKCRLLLTSGWSLTAHSQSYSQPASQSPTAHSQPASQSLAAHTQPVIQPVANCRHPVRDSASQWLITDSQSFVPLVTAASQLISQPTSQLLTAVSKPDS